MNMPGTSGPSTSFIPDSTVVAPKQKGPDKISGLADVLLLVSIILISASLALASAVFLYARYKEKAEAEKRLALQTALSDVTQEATIRELTLLSKRLSAGKQILSSHIAPTQVFKALEEHTLKSVQFVNFKLVKTKESVQLDLEGRALTVNAVAAQSKEFAKADDKFKNVIFSNLGFEEDGMVKFKVSAEVDPAFIAFASVVHQAALEGAAGPVESAGDIQNNNFGNPNWERQGFGRRQGFETQNNNPYPDNQENTNLETDMFGNPINY